MLNADAQPLIDKILQHIDNHTSWKRGSTVSIPAAHYVDRAHLRREHDALFTGRPQVVALSSELRQPGSWLTRELAGLPVVVARAEDGAIAASVNVCAHRGARVVDGRGCSRRLTCPYHAWTYRPDGSLAGIPDASAFPDHGQPRSGLVRLPAVEEHGIVWVLADPARAGEVIEPPDLGAIGRDLDSFDLANMEFWRSHRFELDFNWKLVIDTFLEPYHFASLHRNTVGPYFIANLCIAERIGDHVREILPRRTITALVDEPRDRWDVIPHSTLVYVLFPNTVFVMQLDHVEIWRVQPAGDDPQRCVCELDFHVPIDHADDAHWEKNWKVTIDTVLAEDFAAMATVQQGAATGVIDELTAGRNEPALGFYHESLRDALARADEAARQRIQA